MRGDSGFLGWLFGRLGKGRRKIAKKAARPRHRSLRFEACEARQLLSAVPPLLTSSPNGSAVGQTVTFTARVPSGVSGTMSLAENGSNLVSNVPLIADPNSDAINLYGPDAFARLPDTLKFTSGNFTISEWFKPASTDSNLEFLFMRGFGYGDQPGDIGLHYDGYGYDNFLQFTAQGNGTGWIFGWDLPPSLLYAEPPASGWSNIVVTRSIGETTSTYAMWLNGILVGSETSAADISDANNTNPLLLGAMEQNSGPGFTFQGQIDEFDIFSRAVNPGEITTLYNGGAGFYGSTAWGPTAEGLLAGYHFDSNVDDYSGNGYNGTLYGSAGWAPSTIATSMIAPFQTNGLSEGTHALTAVFTPSDPTDTSTSDTLYQQVDPDISVSGPATASPGATGLTYTASVISDGTTPGGTFSFTLKTEGGAILDSHTGASASFTAPSTPGTYDVVTAYSGDGHYASYTLTRTLAVSVAPTIGQPADHTTSDTTAEFSVPSPSSDPGVIYEWSADGTDLPAPEFSANDTHDASTTTATFSQAGTYTIRVTAANAAGQAASTTFTVTVNAALTSIAIDPPPMAVPLRGHVQFTAKALDQFGNPMASQPLSDEISWSAINGFFSYGMYTAPDAATNVTDDTINASYDGLSDSLDIQLGGYKVSAGGAATFRANMPYMRTLDSSGVDDDPIESWDIDWGDGTDVQTVTGDPLPNVVPHVYTAGSSHTIHVVANTWLEDFYPIYANNGTPVSNDGVTTALPLVDDGMAIAGNEYTLTLGDGVTDLGSGANVTYTINWNDNTAATVINADDLAAQGDEVTHVFDSVPSGPVTVDLSVAGDPSSPHLSVGSLPVTVDVNATTTTSLTLENSPGNFGDTATLQVQVSGFLPGIGPQGGSVDFFDTTTSGTIKLYTANVDSTRMASYTTLPLSNGEHHFTAVYNGDDWFLPSTSGDALATIASTTNSVSVSISSILPGQYHLTAPGNLDLADAEWSIDWGDGTPYTSATFHVYGASGTYTVTAVAIDANSAAFRASQTLTISLPGPSGLSVTVDDASYSGADTSDGGSLSPDMLHVSFTGPESLTSYNVSIDWGDGTIANPDATEFALGPGQHSFDYPLPQYSQSGSHHIAVTVTDAESRSASNSTAPLAIYDTNTQISGLALSLDNSTVYAGDVGPTLSGSFTDPQWNVSHSVTIDWDDGSGTPDISTIALATGENSFQAGPHSYATAGSYTVSVTITGTDGTLTGTAPTTVENAPAEVMIGATTPAASEYYNSGAVFSVTCGGGTASDVTVNVAIGGSAVYGYGNDYTITSSADISVAYDGLSGTITMPGDGPTTATIWVTPNYPGVLADSKTVTLTLGSGTDYNVVSADSTATATIYYDDASSSSATNETGVNIACYSPDGSQASSESAIVGDYIPVGLGVASPVANPTTVSGILTYPSSLKVSYTPGGTDIGSGNVVQLHATETIVYVTAADPTDDQANDVTASGTLTLVGHQFSTVTLNTCSADVAFKPIQLGVEPSVIITDHNGTEVVDGKTVATEAARNVKVGQVMNLYVDPVGEIGVAKWFVDRNTISDFLTGDKSEVIYFSPAHVGTEARFCWTDEGVKDVSVTVYTDQGAKIVGATFVVDKPTVNPSATVFRGGNDGTNFVVVPPPFNTAVFGLGFFTVDEKTLELHPLKPGIEFDPGKLPNGWNYVWVQTVTVEGHKVNLDPNGTFDQEVKKNTGLDGPFPYDKAKTDFLGNDSPAIEIEKGWKGDYNFSANMWLMCRPTDTDVWVPLKKVEWSYTLEASYIARPQVIKSTPSPLPGKSAVIQDATNDFPSWMHLVKKKFEKVPRKK
jgi:hypothetical protein